MKSCFLLTHIPDPRLLKRIEVFKQFGEVYVVCARRSNQNFVEINNDDVNFTIINIDLPLSKQLLKRYVYSTLFQNKAFKILKNINPDIIYTEGLDCLQLIYNHQKAFSKCRVFYEVADLREIFISNPKEFIKKLEKKLILYFDKKYFNCVDCLVVTSLKFYDVYYCNLINRSKVLYMPNVPEKSCFEGFVKKEDGDFTIGFIGGIRYIRQMKILVDVAGKIQAKVLFAGAGGTNKEYEEIFNYCKDKSWVSFTGKYDYNKEIANLYSKVDCVYCVYDADNPNVKIALPNKLYEAVLCHLPIIVAQKTYLAEMVEKWGVGYSVSHHSKIELEDVLLRIKNKENYNFDFSSHEKELDLGYYNSKLIEAVLQNNYEK